jgi:monoamine oxidase
VPLAGIDAMPVGGYTGMLQKAFDKSGADVRLHQQVVKIKDAGDKVQVTTKTGETHSASHVICTVPLTLLNAGTIEFDPPLDASRQRVMKRTSVGVLNKLLLVYPEVWWPPRVSHFL